MLDRPGVMQRRRLAGASAPFIFAQCGPDKIYLTLRSTYPDARSLILSQNTRSLTPRGAFIHSISR